MLNEKDASEILFKYVEEKTRKIHANAINSIASTVANTKVELKDIMDSIREQAKHLEVLMPINLIELIANGGYVLSEDVKVHDATYFRVNVGGKDIFYDPTKEGLTLEEGKYRITLIVENRDSEPQTP